MINFSKLFSRAPFAPMLNHMEKVSGCVSKLQEIFDVLIEADQQKVEYLATELSQLEHEADCIKNEIRKNLPKSIFMPIDRSQLLELIANQDTIADVAEDVAILLQLKPFRHLPELKDDLSKLVAKNIETFMDAKEIIYSMEQLLESSFGGPEAVKVKALIDKTSYKEHEADVLKSKLLKKLFKLADDLSTPDFYLWMRVLDDVALISHFSEKLATRIGMLLATKS